MYIYILNLLIQIQDLCPALGFLFLSLLFLSFPSCCASIQPLWINLILPQGNFCPCSGMGGWVLPAASGSWGNFNSFAAMLPGFCEQDLRQAILISLRKFVISISCWSYVSGPRYRMHKALGCCIQHISEQTSFTPSGWERSFLSRTLSIWGNVTEK